MFRPSHYRVANTVPIVNILLLCDDLKCNLEMGCNHVTPTPRRTLRKFRVATHSLRLSHATKRSPQPALGSHSPSGIPFFLSFVSPRFPLLRLSASLRHDTTRHGTTHSSTQTDATATAAVSSRLASDHLSTPPSSGAISRGTNTTCPPFPPFPPFLAQPRPVTNRSKGDYGRSTRESDRERPERRDTAINPNR
jgi:predicted component of type VI protein secretion system